MKILAIETSCDETALALLEASGSLSSLPKFKILKEEVASQVKIHRPFGGVVPNLAKREHQKNLPLLLRRLKLTVADWKKIDLIAVTVGPGLEPALWQGIEFAKALGKENKKPVLGVNHLEGHLYSFLLRPTTYNLRPTAIFPAIALIVSGGHTILLLLKDLKNKKVLGETRDDAAGEAFDKVARLLRLPYPGGPEIEKLAAKKAGWTDTINFPRPMLSDKNYDFSFSGLKTAVLYYLRDNPEAKRAEVAAAFSRAVIDVLTKKTMRAGEEFKAKSIMLSGGVAANKSLREALRLATEKSGKKFLVAEQKHNTDNAVMIASAAYVNYLRRKKYPLRANGALSI